MMQHFDLTFQLHLYNQPKVFQINVKYEINTQRFLTETTANSLAATCKACARSNRCFALVNASRTSRSLIRAS